MNQLYIEAKEIFNNPQKVTRLHNEEARDLLNTARSAEGSDPYICGLLSYSHVRDFQNAWNGNRDGSLEQAEFWADEELKFVDETSKFDGHWSRAIVYANQGRFPEAFTEYGIAMESKPDDFDLLAEMGEALMYAGRFDEALEQIKMAISSKPGGPLYWFHWNRARVEYMIGEFQDAIDTIALIENPPADVFMITAASKAKLGRTTEAKDDMDKFMASEPDWTLAHSAHYRYANDSHRQHWLSGLSMAGLK